MATLFAEGYSLGLNSKVLYDWRMQDLAGTRVRDSIGDKEGLIVGQAEWIADKIPRRLEIAAMHYMVRYCVMHTLCDRYCLVSFCSRSYLQSFAGVNDHVAVGGLDVGFLLATCMHACILLFPRDHVSASDYKRVLA